jgi:hypothetical protein
MGICAGLVNQWIVDHADHGDDRGMWRELHHHIEGFESPAFNIATMQRIIDTHVSYSSSWIKTQRYMIDQWLKERGMVPYAHEAFRPYTGLWASLWGISVLGGPAGCARELSRVIRQSVDSAEDAGDYYLHVGLCRSWVDAHSIGFCVKGSGKGVLYFDPNFGEFEINDLRNLMWWLAPIWRMQYPDYNRIEVDVYRSQGRARAAE